MARSAIPLEGVNSAKFGPAPDCCTTHIVFRRQICDASGGVKTWIRGRSSAPFSDMSTLTDARALGGDGGLSVMGNQFL